MCHYIEALKPLTTLPLSKNSEVVIGFNYERTIATNHTFMLHGLVE